MTCPVVQTIAEIRGGFMNEEDEGRTIRLGGGDCEYVMDEVSYFITTRKLKLARFKMSGETAEASRMFARELYEFVSDRAMTLDYKKIFPMYYKLFYEGFMYKQYVKVVDMIGELQKVLQKKLLFHKNLNISIPSIAFSPNIDQILEDPRVLTKRTNEIIDYVNGFNLNSILKEPITKKIERIGEFTEQRPDETFSVPAVDSITVLDTIMHHETIIADYMQKLERYHCDVINRLNEMFEICKKIIESI